MITWAGQHCQHPLCQTPGGCRPPTVRHNRYTRSAGPQRLLACACQRISASEGCIDSAAEAILHRYWESRGLFDENRRQGLVSVARRLNAAGARILGQIKITIVKTQLPDA